MFVVVFIGTLDDIRLSFGPVIINYLDVVPSLEPACPSYRSSADAAAADIENAEFMRIGYFAAHLVRLLSHGDTQHLGTVMTAIEWLLEAADSKACRIVSHGLMEDLTNPRFYLETPLCPEDFLPWFGPRLPCLAALSTGTPRDE